MDIPYSIVVNNASYLNTVHILNHSYEFLPFKNEWFDVVIQIVSNI